MPIHLNIPATEYQDMRGLRASTINAILDNPARYRHKLETPSTTKTFTLGSATHSLLLEDGKDVEVIHIPDPAHKPDPDNDDDQPPMIPVMDWRTKKAQAARDEALERGIYPLTLPEREHAQAMADALTTHPEIAPHLESGLREATITGLDPDTFTPLKGRLDILNVEARTILDPKTVASAHPRDFPSHAYRYGYHVTTAQYIELAAQATDTDPDEWTFLFALVEKDAPYLHAPDHVRDRMTPAQKAAQHLTHVTQLSGEFLDIGRADRRHGIDLYLDCQHTGNWPGYPQHITTTDAPRWALARA